jgi:5-methylthioadenosine/S-adenosylhomocysteine deaminase
MPASRVAAEWLLPMDAEPVPWGAVLIGADGRIAAVGPDDQVPQPPGVPAERFPGAVILPGLINAHTHLELTGLEGKALEPDFAEWIARIIALKAERTPADYLAAAQRGLADCHAAGVTTVADTGDSGAPAEALARAGGSGIAYVEVFGPDPGQADLQLGGLQARVADLRRYAGPRVRLGVSPHAPYSVSGPLYAAVTRWARGEDLPIAVHLAESPAESELLAAANGPFARLWERRGIRLPELPGCSPVDWLHRHGALTNRTLCIHVVQVKEGDIARLRQAGCGIAHCPRSNERHGHGRAPLGALQAAGLRIGVGTDSVASVSPADLLAEARAARRLGGLDAVAALALCTLRGAEAIGLEREVGSLTVGKWGDLAVFQLREGGAEVHEAVLARHPTDVLGTYIGGMRVWRRAD